MQEKIRSECFFEKKNIQNVKNIMKKNLQKCYKNELFSLL